MIIQYNISNSIYFRYNWWFIDINRWIFNDHSRYLDIIWCVRYNSMSLTYLDLASMTNMMTFKVIGISISFDTFFIIVWYSFDVTFIVLVFLTKRDHFLFLTITNLPQKYHHQIIAAIMRERKRIVSRRLFVVEVQWQRKIEREKLSKRVGMATGWGRGLLYLPRPRP